MSLESNIAKLTIAIEALTAQMVSSSVTSLMTSGADANISDYEKESKEKIDSVNEEATSEDKATAEKINAAAEKKALAKAKAKKEAAANAKAEAEQESTETEVSADDLKAACLKAARAEEGNKVKVKKLLASYGKSVV